MDSPQDMLRIAQALLRACRTELAEARLTDRIGVTLLVHPAEYSLHPTRNTLPVTALATTLGTRQQSRAVMMLATLSSLEADGADRENIGRIAEMEIAELLGLREVTPAPEPPPAQWLPPSVKPLDVNENDCAKCGQNVASVWDADNVGRCKQCGEPVQDAGREETLRRRAERGWQMPRGGERDANT